MKNHLHCFICRGAISLLLCLSFFTNAFSQHLILGNEDFKVEAGLNFGPTTFLGDLGGNAGYGTKGLKDVNLPVTKMMKGVFITAYPNNWLGFRFGAEYTYLEGADSLIHTNGINELYRKERNLDFRSDVWEAYGAIELFPIMLMKHNDPDYTPRFRPYFFAGVGVFHFDPMGSLTENGITTWYHLQPLHTEGEGFPEYPDRKNYALTQINIPMGGGLKYFASDRMNISLEVLYRKTFTDYIDDVSTTYIDPSLFDKYLSPANAAIAKQIYDKIPSSQISGYSRFAPGEQRGNPNNTDAYFSILLKFGFRLGTIYESSFSDRQKNQMRCPGRF
jgi:hypothetical protein